MKKLLLLIVVLFSFLGNATTIDGRIRYYSNNNGNPWLERILNFHSDIKILENRVVIIKETIVVNSTGTQIRRGIYRDIPLEYEWGIHHKNVKFNLLEVLHNGEPEPYHTESMSNGIRIYVGDANVFIPDGVHIYEISYATEYTLGMFDESDGLYWNVNGNGWLFQVDKASATVFLPPGATVLSNEGYTGGYGSQNSDVSITTDSTSVHFETTMPLGATENLSVIVEWDKNHIVYPTTWEQIYYFLWCYGVWVVSGLFLILGVLYNFIMWWKYGRDPKPGTIIPRFYPPGGMSPAECAYLHAAGRRTNTMMGAQIMSLASKGWIEIDNYSKGNYKLTKTPENSKKKDLNDVEQTFYNKLMYKDSLTIRKNTYSAKVAGAGKSLEDSIDLRQDGVYYIRNSHLKIRQFIFPALTIGAGLLTKFMIGGAVWIPIVIGVLHVAINIVFTRLYEQPTRKGRKTMDEIAGFVMYMRYANKERIKLMNPPSMNFTHFEENLAYAIALGVAEEWAGQFDQEVIDEANHGGMSYMHGMMFASYASFGQIGSDMSRSISAASTPPSTSGSGGYSGGGGFSGGGFGGGGGGGW